MEFLPLPASFNIPLLANGTVSDIVENADGSFWVATNTPLKTNNYSLTTERNGIRNLTERTKKWKGQMIVDSKLNEGTSIKITIPMTS